MASLLPWLALVAFSTLVAVSLIVLGLRNALRALAFGYLVVLLAGYLPIALHSGWVPSLSDILPTMVISLIFTMPGILFSVLGAALVFKLPAAQRRGAVSIGIGIVLGTLGGFVSWSSVTRGHGTFPWWVGFTLGAGAGACWGILAPGVFRPNRPRPPSGGPVPGGGGSMGSTARG